MEYRIEVLEELRSLEREFDRLDKGCRDEWTYRGRTRRYQALWEERTRVRALLLAADARE